MRQVPAVSLPHQPPPTKARVKRQHRARSRLPRVYAEAAFKCDTHESLQLYANEHPNER